MGVFQSIQDGHLGHWAIKRFENDCNIMVLVTFNVTFAIFGFREGILIYIKFDSFAIVL